MRCGIEALLVGAVLIASRASAVTVTSTWNGTSGNWTDSARWSNNPPTVAYPNNGGGTTYNATVGGGLTTLDAPIEVENLEINSGYIRGPNDLTVTGTLTFYTGKLSGPGTTTVKGALTLDSTNTKVLDGGRILRNEGVATWKSGGIDLNGFFGGTHDEGSGAFVNAAGGLFDIKFDFGTFGYTAIVGTDFGTDSHFDNAGTVRKSAGNGHVTISVTFNNSGTLDAQSGTISFPNSTTHSGAIVTGNGTVIFGGVPGYHSHDFDAATTINAAHVTLGGTSTINATYNVSGSTILSTGVVNFLGPVVSLGSLTVASGAVGNLGSSNQSVSMLTVSNGTLTSAGNLTSTGLMTFQRGTLSGAGNTIAAGGLSLSGSNAKVIDGGRTLTNPGTANWSAGQLNLNGNTAPGFGTFINSATGLFNNTFDGSIIAPSFADADSGMDATFHNAGAFRKSAGAGSTTISTTFNNTGTVEVLSGTFALTGPVPQHIAASLIGGSWRAVSTASPAKISFTGSPIQEIAASATVELSGTGASLDANATPLANSLSLNAGTLRLFNGHAFAAQTTAFANIGTIELGGSGLAPASFNAVLSNNSGTIRGQGQITGKIVNTGRIEGAFGAPLLAIAAQLGGAGVLKDVQINGVHSPGADIATVSLDGVYALSSSARLIIDIGASPAGTQHDQLVSTGNVNLGGELQVPALNLGGGVFTATVGQRYPIITAASTINGTFLDSSVTTIASATAITWNVVYGSQTVELEIAALKPLIPGDYNGDDKVDSADYTVWRKLLNSNVLAADGNQDGQINSSDHAVWRAHFGQVSAPASAAAVPEPAARATLALTIVLIPCVRRFEQLRSRLKFSDAHHV